MSEHPVFALATDLLAILDELKISYMLIGGVSVRFWALPRPTYDLDVTVSADESQLQALFIRLEKEGYVIPDDVRRGWRDTLAGMKKFAVRKFIARDSWRVDVFLVTTEYQQSAFSRRKTAKLLGKDVWTIGPEDLVLHKLVAGRERDLADVGEILALTRDMDLAYLRKWAGVLGVADGLEERLRRAGLAT